jgi:hypothetical protein
MMSVPAIGAAGDCVARETAQNGATRDARYVAMRDSAADDAATDRTENSSRGMAMAAAGVGRSRASDAKCNDSGSDQSGCPFQHRKSPSFEDIRATELRRAPGFKP